MEIKNKHTVQDNAKIDSHIAKTGEWKRRRGENQRKMIIFFSFQAKHNREKNTCNCVYPSITPTKIKKKNVNSARVNGEKIEHRENLMCVKMKQRWELTLFQQIGFLALFLPSAEMWVFDTIDVVAVVFHRLTCSFSTYAKRYSFFCHPLKWAIQKYIFCLWGSDLWKRSSSSSSSSFSRYFSFCASH